MVFAWIGTIFWKIGLNSFSYQIILVASHTPSVPTPSTIRTLWGLMHRSGMGIAFNKRHYLSIWWLIPCLLSFPIIYYFLFIIQYCIHVQFRFFSFPWHIPLNKLYNEPTWWTYFSTEMVNKFGPTLTKISPFQKFPLRAYGATRNTTSDFR